MYLSFGLTASVLLLLLSTSQCTALTPLQFTQKAAQLRQVMSNPSDPAGRLTAGAVRLAFHDCVGGCDGCINLQNSDNAGLQAPIQALETIFQSPGQDGSSPAQQLMSRADFWALSGIVGAEVAADRPCPGGVGPCNRPRPAIVFKTGRQDCSTSPSTQVMHQFPNAHAGTTATLEFFAQQFGFNDRQSVAIMGAHTLGRSSPQNSGFNGAWVNREGVLDNDYYREINRNWNQRNIRSGADPRFQWFRGGRNTNIMLNVDMCLLKELRVNAAGASGCARRSNDCADSRTAGVVRQYSNNNAAWMQDFSQAFQIMIENGASGLLEPSDDVSGSSSTVATSTSSSSSSPAGSSSRISARPETSTRVTVGSTTGAADTTPPRVTRRSTTGAGDTTTRPDNGGRGRGDRGRDGGDRGRDGGDRGRGGRRGGDGRGGRRGRSLIDALFH